MMTGKTSQQDQWWTHWWDLGEKCFFETDSESVFTFKMQPTKIKFQRNITWTIDCWAILKLTEENIKPFHDIGTCLKYDWVHGSGRVRSAIFGLGLENFPQKFQIFQFFALWAKKILLSRVQKYSDQFFSLSKKTTIANFLFQFEYRWFFLW